MAEKIRFEVSIEQIDDQSASATLFRIDPDGESGDALLVGIGASPLQALADLVETATERHTEPGVEAFVTNVDEQWILRSQS